MTNDSLLEFNPLLCLDPCFVMMLYRLNFRHRVGEVADFLGRTAADPDFDVEGSLAVSAVVPPPKLDEALALAEANRPDLLSDRKSIDQANAVVEHERRKAPPDILLEQLGTALDIPVDVLYYLAERMPPDFKRPNLPEERILAAHEAFRRELGAPAKKKRPQSK